MCSSDLPHPHFCLFCPPSLNLFFWFSPPPERRVSAPPPSRMVVRIRLARWGRRHLPFFRIVVADGRSPRDGRHLDVVGSYNAAGHSAAEVAARVKRVELDVARIKYWLSVGAQPSDTVARLLGYAGILPRPPLSRAAHKIPATVRRVSLPETPLVAAIATMAPPPPSLADALGGEGGEAAGVVRQPAAASR